MGDIRIGSRLCGSIRSIRSIRGIGISTNCRTAGIGRQYGERHGTHGEVFGVHIAAEFQAGCGFSSCGDYGIGTLRGHRNGVVSGNIIGYLRRHGKGDNRDRTVGFLGLRLNIDIHADQFRRAGNLVCLDVRTVKRVGDADFPWQGGGGSGDTRNLGRAGITIGGIGISGTAIAGIGTGAIAGAALPYHIPTDRLPFGIGDGVHITCRSEHRTVINRSRTRHPSTAENRSHAQCATDQCGTTSHLRIPFIQSTTTGIPFPY